jgi:hypothetical protein
VDEFPAATTRRAAAVAVRALAGAALDAAQLLDVDVHKLAGPLALVAVGRLGRLQARQLAEPDTGQDALHRGERHTPA